MLPPTEQPGNASLSPEASEQRRRRENGQPPTFVLDGPTSTNDAVISSRPGPDETSVKRRSGKTLVNRKSKTNINEAAGSPQLSSGWSPDGPADFQSMSDRPSDHSDVPSHILSLEAEPFVPGRRLSL